MEGKKVEQKSFSTYPVILTLLFLSFLFLLGCTSDLVLPYTTSQYVGQSTDLNLTLFQQGYYDGNCLRMDGNLITAGSCVDVNAGPLINHNELNNLAWSVAGHVMDDDLNMAGNAITNAVGIDSKSNLGFPNSFVSLNGLLEIGHQVFGSPADSFTFEYNSTTNNLDVDPQNLAEDIIFNIDINSDSFCLNDGSGCITAIPIDTNAQTACTDQNVLFGDGTCSPVSIANVFYAPQRIVTEVGTNSDGNIDSVITLSDGDGYFVDEVAGTPGFQIVTTFNNVTEFNEVRIHEWYMGSAGHAVVMQLYNFDTTTYDNIDSITDQGDFVFSTVSVVDDTDYINGSGDVNFRIIHSSAGNPTHDINIDYIALVEEQGGFTPVDHGSLTGLIDDDHMQYVLADGTRSLTGTWTIIGQDINSNADINANRFCFDDESGCITEVPTSSVDTNIYSENVDVNLINSSPEIRLTDSDDNRYTRISRDDVGSLTMRQAQLGKFPSGSFAFDYTNSNRSRKTSASGLGAYTETTISLWLQRDNTDQTEQVFTVYKNVGSLPAINVHFVSSGSGLFYFDIFTSAGNNIRASIADTALDGGAWHHVVVRWTGTDETGLSIWVDGADASSSNSEIGTFAGMRADADAIILGGFTNRYDGRVDEVNMWSSALSDNDIADLWNGGNGLYVTTDGTFPTDGGSMGTDLEGLWHLDEGTGTNQADDSTNSNDLTVFEGTEAWVAGKVTAGLTYQDKNIWVCEDGTVADEGGICTFGDTELKINIDADQGIYLNDNTYLQSDSDCFYWGATDDVSSCYDGTNFVINPKEVGSGIVDIDGDINADQYCFNDGTGCISAIPSFTDTNIYTENVDVNLINTSPEIRLTDLDNNKYGSLTKSDSSNEFKITNEVGTPLVTSYAIDLDGTNDYVNTPTNTLMNGKASGTISFWAYIDTVTAFDALFFSRGGGNNLFGIDLETSPDRYTAYLNSGGTTLISFSKSTVITGAWHHVVLRWDAGSASSMFINNVEATGSAVSGSIAQTDAIRIGYDDFAAGRKADSKIEEFVIWDRALTDSEVGDLYNSGNGLGVATTESFPSTSTSMSTNMILLYHFNENSPGASVIDSSGNGRNGTPVSSPPYTAGITFPAPTEEATIVSSIDGTAVGEQGIHTFGDADARTIIEAGTGIFMNDNSYIQSDSDCFYSGAADDASYCYDGSNLNINPDEVGSGNVVVDASVVTEGTGAEGFYIKRSGTTYGSLTTNNIEATLTYNNGDFKVLNDSTQVMHLDNTTGDVSFGQSDAPAGTQVFMTKGAADTVLGIASTNNNDQYINFMESYATYGFSQGYWGSDNYWRLKRHDNSAAGVEVIKIPRTSSLVNMYADVNITQDLYVDGNIYGGSPVKFGDSIEMNNNDINNARAIETDVFCLGENCITELNGMRYVDRGDPSSPDFTVGDFTTDESWYDFDLSSIVPEGATAVDVRVNIADNAVASWFMLRQKGNSSNFNIMRTETQVANSAIRNHNNGIIALDENRFLQYRGANVSFTTLSVTIKGWFIPAMDAGEFDQNLSTDSNVIFDTVTATHLGDGSGLTGIVHDINGTDIAPSALCLNGTCITELNGMRYVERGGDPSVVDFDEGDLTQDAAWHDLDLSSIVPEGATAVQLRVKMNDEAATSFIFLRKNGLTNFGKAFSMETQVGGVSIRKDALVSLDENRVIEYYAEAVTFVILEITVAGWFIPAMDAGVLDQNVNSDSNVQFGGLTVNGTVSFPQQSIVRAHATSNQTIANSTNTVIVLAGERIDTLDEFASNKFTAKNAGKYLVTGNILWKNTNSGTDMAVMIAVNGTTQAWNYADVQTTSQWNNYNVTDIVELEVGDYVELRAQQLSGGNEDTHGTAATVFLAITKVA